MTNKMTQKDYFNEIIAVAQAAGREDLVEFAQGRIAAIEKKAASKKPTKTQSENEELKVTLLAVMADSEPMTVTEIMAKDERLAALSNQKVSAILRQMVEAKDVVKTTDKKRSLFAVA